MSKKIPTFDRLMNPLLRALGCSGSVEEIYDKVVEMERIPEDVLSQLHDPERSNQTEVGYRLAWARTYFRKFGLLENSSRGVWSLTSKAKNFNDVDPKEVLRVVRALGKPEQRPKAAAESDELEFEQAEDEPWQRTLHSILTKKLAPEAFERLVQRMLRESGLTQVEVTGRSGVPSVRVQKRTRGDCMVGAARDPACKANDLAGID